MVGQGLVIAAVGVAIGLAGALFATRFLTSLLFGVTTNDLATWLAVPVALLLVAAGAALVPARRAAAVDPIDALRAE